MRYVLDSPCHTLLFCRPSLARHAQTDTLPPAMQNSRIIFEAAWALTNVASGNSDHTAAAVEAGVVPVFVDLLDHPIPEIVDQAVRRKCEGHAESGAKEPSPCCFFFYFFPLPPRLCRPWAWSIRCHTLRSTSFSLGMGPGQHCR